MNYHLRWKWSGTPGMDLHDALAWACKTLNPRRYLEIGVDGGGSLITVLNNSPIMEDVVLCDMWDGEHAGHGFKDHLHIIPIIQSHGVRALFMDGDSKKLVPTIGKEPPFDLILVDGDHSKEGATADMENVWPLLNEGGMLVFDDVGHVNYREHLMPVLWHFIMSHEDCSLIGEQDTMIRNCAIIQKI